MILVMLLYHTLKKKFIEKTIKSILSQTYKNFEIIVVSDDLNRSDLKFIKKLKIMMIELD